MKDETTRRPHPRPQRGLAALIGLQTLLICGAAPATAQTVKAIEVVAAKSSSCALMDDGTVRCWGTGPSGQLGHGQKSNEPLPPVLVKGLAGAKRIFLGGSHYTFAFCAQDAAGKVQCWGGSNAFPQETKEDALTPVAVPVLDGVRDVAVSLNGFACAALADGTVGCWGQGAFGVLGNGDTKDQKTPVRAAGVQDAVDVACGQNHCCAATAAGQVWCWGYNSSGQVDPKTENRDPVKTPVQVAGITDAVAVGAGASTSCAILKDGSAVCWGSNFYQGPKPLEGAGTVQRIAGSDSHLCAVNTEDRLYCWGSNYFGQIGEAVALQQSSNKPVEVGVPPVVSFSTGDGYTCAVTKDGDVLCWGKNEQGQLAQKAGDPVSAPTVLAAVRASAQEIEASLAKAEQFLKDERASLTPEKYEELMLAMASCELKERDIDPKCPAKVAFDKAKSRNTSLQDLAGLNARLGQKHIGHESPAVRLIAAGLMGSIFGANPASQQLLLDAAAKEPHPVVLYNILRSVGSSMGKNEAVHQLVLRALEHPEELVRIEAVSNMTAWGKQKEGALEKVSWIVENDASPKVRQYACDNLGRMEDERALPLLERLTSEANTDQALYEACMEGIVRMWAGFPKPDKPSQKAYELTLARLTAEPRTEKRPPSGILFDLTSTISNNPNDSFHKKWAEQATWFKPEQVTAALEALVQDRNAGWTTRTGAIDTMVKFGVPKATFEKLLAGYADVEGKRGNDSWVLDKLKKVAAQ